MGHQSDFRKEQCHFYKLSCLAKQVHVAEILSVHIHRKIQCTDSNKTAVF